VKNKTPKEKTFNLTEGAVGELTLLVTAQEVSRREFFYKKRGFDEDVEKVLTIEAKRLGLANREDIVINWSGAVLEGKISVRDKTPEELEADSKKNPTVVSKPEEKKEDVGKKIKK